MYLNPLPWPPIYSADPHSIPGVLHREMSLRDRVSLQMESHIRRMNSAAGLELQPEIVNNVNLTEGM